MMFLLSPWGHVGHSGSFTLLGDDVWRGLEWDGRFDQTMVSNVAPPPWNSSSRGPETQSRADERLSLELCNSETSAQLCRGLWCGFGEKPSTVKQEDSSGSCVCILSTQKNPRFSPFGGMFKSNHHVLTQKQNTRVLFCGFESGPASILFCIFNTLRFLWSLYSF